MDTKYRYPPYRYCLQPNLWIPAERLGLGEGHGGPASKERTRRKGALPKIFSPTKVSTYAPNMTVLHEFWVKTRKKNIFLHPKAYQRREMP